MKKIITLLALSLSTAAFSQTAGLDQQLAVTKDAIAQLTLDLRTRDSAGGLRLTDYRQWEAQYKQNMEKNFETYEKNIRMRVFGPLKEIISKMHVIAEDKKLDERQKHSLLESYKNQLENMKPSLQKEYHKLLKQLYDSNNTFPTGLKVVATRFYNKNGKEVSKPSEKGNSVKDIQAVYYDAKEGLEVSSLNMKKHSEINLFKLDSFCNYNSQNIYIDLKEQYSQDWSLSGCREGTVHHRYGTSYGDECSENKKEYIKKGPLLTLLKKSDYKFVMERIKQGCQSKACLILKASEISFWYESISRLLDKDIVIEIPLKKMKQIDHYTYQSTQLVSDVLTIPALNLNPKDYSEILRRNDFPVEFENLPFDI